MKFLHLADLHLGKSIYGKSLIEDQKYFVENILCKTIESENPDAVLICGDIFDRAVPPAEAILLFNDILETISIKYGKKLYIIAGNHDGADRLILGASLLKNSGVYFKTQLEKDIVPFEYSDEYGDYAIYLLPYFDAAVCRYVYGDDSIKGFSGAYNKVIGEISENLDTSKINILLAHAFLSGGKVSESESQIFVGGSGEVSHELFEIFDYTALGHLHSPQKYGNKIRYSGSPLKYSFDECNQKKCILSVEIKGKNDLSVTEIPIYPQRDMQRIEGLFDDLIKQGAENKNRNYLEVTVTDDKPIFEPMARLREVYPNILSLRSNWQIGRTSDDLQGPSGRGLSDTELINEFFREIYKTEVSDLEWEMLTSAMESEVDN